VDKAKPFDIPKREVWEAFKKVKANQGAAGVDGQSVADFEAELSDNLYKLWNRMSSGSYFPPPVRRVMIPKPGGSGERPLGIPTVGTLRRRSSSTARTRTGVVISRSSRSTFSVTHSDRGKRFGTGLSTASHFCPPPVRTR
jgi:hypothetical protein